MGATSEQFRDAMRHFPSGVTIVTILSEGRVHGLTVSAFASVSPDPPLVLVVIDHQHSAHKMLQQPGSVFAVNVLSQEQVDLSNRFAWVRDEDRFAEGKWGTATTGAPILTDALTWLDCTISTSQDAGTHTIFVGEVQAVSVPLPEQPPLIYWNRGYRRLDLFGSQ